MFDMTQLALMVAQLQETTEERVERLETTAAESDADAETLYDVEEELRRAGKIRLDELDEDTRQQWANLKQQVGPMVGVDPEYLDDLALLAVARILVDDPRRTAEIVATLDDVFSRQGLYDELDIETPSPGELSEPIDVDVLE